jgi:hypothetical protein
MAKNEIYEEFMRIIEATIRKIVTEQELAKEKSIVKRKNNCRYKTKPSEKNKIPSNFLKHVC